MRSLLVCAVVACGGSAATPDTPKPRVGDLGVDIQNLTTQLPPFIDSIGAGDPKRGFSGYVLVAQHDQVLWSGAYGLADRAKQQVPTATTSFRIGSVTKQFTATAILKLEQDGKLSVDDKVSKYLPEVPGPAKDVTIHQLLTHTAGVWSYTSDPAILARKAERFTTRQLLELFWDRPLDFTPGAEFKYSNSGYALLGAIIEKASGTSYGQYLAKELFAPGNLERTVVGDAEGVPDRAEGYSLEGGDVVPADKIDMSMPYAAGAIRSTAEDLMRWHRVLSGDTILKAPARAKLYKAALKDYAYGWVNGKVRDKAVIWHNGGIDGFNTAYWRVPDADLVVIAWTNVLSSNADKVAKAAVQAALGDKLEPLQPERPGAMDPEVTKALVGNYEITATERERLLAMKLPEKLIDSVTTIEITAGTGALVVKPNGQGAFEPRPMGDGTFLEADHQIRLRFERTAGNATAVTLEQGPLVIRYTRK